MSSVDLAIDGALACLLPLLAWRVVVTLEHHSAVVLFIAFGLLSALAWARLRAPDVALVEAAVGAGLTGALLMNTLGWVRGAHPPPVRRSQRAIVAVLLGALFLALALVVLSLPQDSTGLRDDVLAQVPSSGVSHPVTAVLLNFRGYDTLLEIAVLLVGAIAAQTQLRRRRGDVEEVAQPGSLLPVLVRLLVPGIVLASGYLLWRGSHAPGGAFQAGAIVAGAGILLILAKTIRPPELSRWPLRAALLAGPGLFVAIASIPPFFGGEILEYPLAWTGELMLALESALTVFIALALVLFFPARRDPA